MTLVLLSLGVRRDGTNELIAVEDGYRESAESWSSILRDLKRRPASAGTGHRRRRSGPVAGDPRRVARNQGAECWVHRLRNVLDKLPKRLQAKAKRALHEIIP